MERPLPDFENPPVVEVALGVQFDPLTELRTPQIGLLWSKFRDRFPNIEEHPPLEPTAERFGVKGSAGPQIKVEMLTKPPVPRCWFLNAAGTELIQIQQDRFGHNWRKRTGDESYPRYPHIRQTFERELHMFEDFLASESFGVIRPTLCEVVYVNHIVAGQGWERHGQLANVLAACTLQYSEAFLPEPEELRMSGSFVIKGEGGEPVGRLRFDVDPGYRRSDGRSILRLTMAARGRPDGTGREDVLRFMDIGRELVVRGFAAVTTPEMHKVWGRKE